VDAVTDIDMDPVVECVLLLVRLGLGDVVTEAVGLEVNETETVEEVDSDVDIVAECDAVSDCVTLGLTEFVCEVELDILSEG